MPTFTESFVTPWPRSVGWTAVWGVVAAGFLSDDLLLPLLPHAARAGVSASRPASTTGVRRREVRCIGSPCLESPRAEQYDANVRLSCHLNQPLTFCTGVRCFQ